MVAWARLVQDQFSEHYSMVQEGIPEFLLLTKELERADGISERESVRLIMTQRMVPHVEVYRQLK